MDNNYAHKHKGYPDVGDKKSVLAYKFYEMIKIRRMDAYIKTLGSLFIDKKPFLS